MVTYYDVPILRCLFANKQRTGAPGWSVESMVGRTVREVVGDEGWRAIEPHVTRALDGAQAHFSRTWRIPGSEERTIEVELAPQIDEFGAVSGIHLLATDVTTRKLAEELLAQRTQELARSNAELELFAYVASHDLQEPLRMVQSFLELLTQRYRARLDADAMEFIGFAVDGARRMRLLIDDLLTYSRVGTAAKPMEPVDLGEVFASVQRNLRVAIDESGAHLGADNLPSVMGDPVQLTQLFQNLIANAIKFWRDQPPQIDIAAQREGDWWRLSVRDNGIGISADQFDRIFVPFQRIHSCSTYPGTGLGLAICKKIVERHGGRIWVESEVGKGSRFNLTLRY
jgi:chemotaxis family two-component system sensor kinase Cph1